MSKQDQVDSVLGQIEEMAKFWPIIDALKGGTDAMRKAGKKYLPKRRMEEETDYEQRLETATLYPAFVDTVDSMVGRVFTKPIKIDESLPADIMGFLSDVDTEDRNLHTFARDWMDDAVSYGISHVLVDMPKNEAKTKADEKALGVRPYASLVKHDQIIGFKSAKIDGNVVLTQVRIVESVTEDDGLYGSVVVQQIRVLNIGSYEVHRKPEGGGWVMVEQGVTTLDIIPLVTLYANRTGFMLAAPPLLQLAHLNVKHWQRRSSADSLIDTVEVPILASIGVTPKYDDDGKEIPGVIIGAKSGIELPQGAEIKYVEHTGAAIGAGRQNLIDLQEEMRAAGGQLLRADTSVMTAAQANTENVKEISRLGMIAQNLEDGLDQVVWLMAKWKGQELKHGNIQVSVNLDPDHTPVESINALINLHNAGVLSKQGLFNEAKRRGLISDDVTWESEQKQIEQSGPEAGEIARLMAKFRETQ